MPDPNSYQAIGWLVVGIAAIIVIIQQGAGLVRTFRGHPENSELKGGADVMAQRLAAVEAEQRESMGRRRAMHSRIDEVRDKLQEEVKEEIGKVYAELNSLRDAVASLKTDNVHQNRHLMNIEGKLDRVIERRNA